MTRQIHVGGIHIGGGAPVTIQSMTNTRTDDVESTLSQIRSLAAAGCQIVRVAVPDGAAARAVAKIKEASPLPVVVDIHFDYKLALEAIAAGADKVRINPGNIGGEDRVKAVVRVPLSERAELARRLRAEVARHVAAREPGELRFQLDPKDLI